jgi:hypothetical protein
MNLKKNEAITGKIMITAQIITKRKEAENGPIFKSGLINKIITVAKTRFIQVSIHANEAKVVM